MIGQIYEDVTVNVNIFALLNFRASGNCLGGKSRGGYRILERGGGVRIIVTTVSTKVRRSGVFGVMIIL